MKWQYIHTATNFELYFIIEGSYFYETYCKTKYDRSLPQPRKQILAGQNC